jgi:hypothetical protein
MASSTACVFFILLSLGIVRSESMCQAIPWQSNGNNSDTSASSLLRSRFICLMQIILNVAE